MQAPDLLEVLKLELEFLKSGGYGKPLSWRPQFIFEDSPTCLHFGSPQQNKLCSERVLMSVPCRHIPLNKKNETIHLPYQYCTKAEMESAVGEWLMNMIEKLERERASNGDGLEKNERIEERFVSSATMVLKCSNPDGEKPFDYRRRLLRFHNDHPTRNRYRTCAPG